MSIHTRSIVRSAALSLALFALAACGGSDDPPNPSVRIAQETFNFTAKEEFATKGTFVGILTGSVNGHSDPRFDMVGTPEPNPDPYPFELAPGGAITVAIDALTAGTYTFQAQAETEGGCCRSSVADVIIVVVPLPEPEPEPEPTPEPISILNAQFSIAENAPAGTAVGTLTAYVPSATEAVFAADDPLFAVATTGEITSKMPLDFEAQADYILAVSATADGAVSTSDIVRIIVTDVDEPILPPPFQNGTAEHPYLVDTLAKLQSIATGFSNEHIVAHCFGIINCDRGELSAAASLAANYRQTADIDASPTAAADYNGGAGFLPIGNCGPDDTCTGNSGQADDNVPFTGSYDGDGYLISGLFINLTTDNGGLFGLTGSDSVLENVALVGVDVRGGNFTGTWVGHAQGTMRQSFASGRLQGAVGTGGLVGTLTSTGRMEANFAVVAETGGASTGGLVGQSMSSVFHSSFALGSVSTSGNQPGGLVGTLTGVLSYSFATGSVTGSSAAGGLVGVSSGTISDSYATGTADFGLVGQGTASSSYRVSGTDSATDATKIALDGLRALACDATTDFRWDDPDDSPDGGPLDCATAGAAAFPWDFGTDADLPVINGLVGGLDAEGQRLAVEFSMVNRTAVTGTITSPATSVEVTLTAPTVGREAGSVLSYYWVLERSTAISADSLRARDVIITASAGSYAAHLTIIERDAAGTLLAVYADEFTLTVN